MRESSPTLRAQRPRYSVIRTCPLAGGPVVSTAAVGTPITAAFAPSGRTVQSAANRRSGPASHRRESAHYVALLPRSEGAIVGSDTGRPLIDGETLRPVTGHDGSLVLEHARVFDAPTEQGFRLFTDPTELGPAWVHNARDPDRLRVGGSLRFTMQPPKGEAFPLSGEFLEIQPPSKIRFTFR